MGVAYFIVLNGSEPGIDTFVNGKAVARHGRHLNRISKDLGLPEIDSFVSYSQDDMEAMQEEFGAAELPDWYQGEQWYEPSVGLEWVAALRRHVEETPASVDDADEVLADLQEYQRVLKQAERAGLKWHFSVDY